MNLIRCGRESRQIKRRSPDQCPFVSRPKRSHPGGHSSRLQKRIDRLISASRWSYSPDRLKGPPFPGLVRIHAADAGHSRARIMSPAADPFDEVCNLGIGQLSSFIFRRHLRTIVQVFDCLDQQTVLRLARLDHRSRIPPTVPSCGSVQSQPAAGLSFGRGMATLALFDQQRPNPLLKKVRITLSKDHAGKQQQKDCRQKLSNGPTPVADLPHNFRFKIHRFSSREPVPNPGGTTNSLPPAKPWGKRIPEKQWSRFSEALS